MRKAFFLTLVLVWSLTACHPNPAAVATMTPIPSESATAAPSPTATDVPPPDPSPTTPGSSATPSPTPFAACSPLEDEDFQSLTEIITNHLDIPPFGQDIGHHGVDFGYYRRGEKLSIAGTVVHAILDGSTVLTLPDKYPYGFTILIETPLDALPAALQESLRAAYLPVPDDPGYRLNCPEIDPPEWNGTYSIYHLYAHLETRPDFSPEDPVQCGQTLGTVGNSGYSSDPHLHLETRLGPSRADFSAMAHYQADVSLEEMATYCLWRMSGNYQLFDPFLIFTAVGKSNSAP